jgi:hypothetical protein
MPALLVCSTMAVGNECRGTNLLTHRMLTPQAHPMNDGLSLYPQAGAVSLSPLDLYSGKMRDRSRLGGGVREPMDASRLAD